jgi:heat shock protein HslJ
VIRSVSTFSLLLTACAAAPDPLAGSEWRVVAINGHTIPAEGGYRMRFKDRQAGGQFGCNHFGGAYQLRSNVMTTSAITMTEMACMGPAGQFESWGIKVLQHPMRIEWRGDKALRLANQAGSIDLAR